MFSGRETIRNVQCIHEKSIFADNRETCFEAWKRSHMCSSALLCGRFADSQESCFLALKRSNMGCPVLEGGRSANIHEFCFQAPKRSDMDCLDMLTVRNGILKSPNVLIIALALCKSVDLLKFTISGFTVRNDEICAVLSCNEVDLLMLRKRVFRLRIVQIRPMP